MWNAGAPSELLSYELLSGDGESAGVRPPMLMADEDVERNGILLKPAVKLPAGEGASL
jgi:hypothetical protein